MKITSLPADRRPILFIDLEGKRHEGVYNQELKAFIEPVTHNEESEDAGNSYMANEILEWEYLEIDKNPDSDIMVIF